jgi:hypothetical protein
MEMCFVFQCKEGAIKSFEKVLTGARSRGTKRCNSLICSPLPGQCLANETITIEWNRGLGRDW